MRETKVQKIARLEKKIEEQKKEMTEIKKDRKRLNYAVDKLKRQNKKLSASSSKEDAAKIKELESKMQSYKDFVPKHNKTVLILKELARRYKILGDSPTISDKDFNMKRLSSFMGGLYEDIDGFPLFDFDTLISHVNILNGGWI